MNGYGSIYAYSERKDRISENVGALNEQLLYDSCLNFFSFMSYFLYYHGQAETYNNYLYIYIYFY